MNLTRPVIGLFSMLLLTPGAALADKHEFSIVVLPDTQLYAESYPALIEAQMQWIVDKRDTENIIYVAHLGDLKDDFRCNDKMIATATGGPRTEWEIIDRAFQKLETATSSAQPHGIPFGTVAGNHDFEPSSSVNPLCTNPWAIATDRILTTYNQRFGPSRFLLPNRRAYYGGSRVEDDPATPEVDEGSNEDNYTLFEWNDYKFIAINLGYRQVVSTANPPPEQAWANLILDEHKDRIAIFTSHYIMRCNNSTTAPTVLNNNVPWNGCNNATSQQNSFSPWGAQVYQSLRNNRNLFMMLGAHERGESYRIETRDGMQPVHAMLSNYQNVSYPSGDPEEEATFRSLLPNAIQAGSTPIETSRGESGFMRIMRFDVDSGTVDIETFAPPVPETPAFIGNKTAAECQALDYVYQVNDVCSTFPISAREYLPSVFTPANPAALDTLHTSTVSNLSFSFADYAPIPDFQLSGSLANDQFLRFLAGTPIAASEVNSRCADGDGCTMTLTRVLGTAAPTVFGPINFSYDPNNNTWSGGSPTATGVNGSGGTAVILGAAGASSCYFSDWDSSTATGIPDRNLNWSVIIGNNTSTPLNCTLTIAD